MIAWWLTFCEPTALAQWHSFRRRIGACHPDGALATERISIGLMPNRACALHIKDRKVLHVLTGV